jgi:hypothetical protein
MTFDKSLFHNLQPTEAAKVRIGNGECIEAKGKGTIAITTNSGTKTIADVLYVPNIDQNLLSVGQLIEKGMKVIFENQHCCIFYAAGCKILQVRMKSKSFSFLPFEEEHNAFPTKLNYTKLWHKRLGHCHQQRMLTMKNSEAVRGIPPFTEITLNCHACQFGKQNRKSFPRSTWRSSQKLQLIHTDVAGPLSTPSLNGSKYYLLFIDDFSRMCWIYFMKFKSEVAGIFWRFKKNVENQSNCRIQAIRSDNGREYTSTEFNLYCEEAGIEHQLTAPYTPEQNGVSERRNRYIMEMARCMLHEKNLPKVFWAEAANTAVFLQNRLSTKLLAEKTPFEVWYNYKPSLSFLKVFGSTCFVHIPQIKRDKLDKKAMQGIFVGYSTISKAYKVYLPQTQKITITRDVQFHEDDKWNWDETQEITVLDDQIITPLQNESIDESIDESPVRGTRSLEEIYQRSNVAVCEPENYEDAQMNPAWQEAMKEEIHMIEKNHTWELVDRPADKNIIGVKWIFRTKLNADSSINKFKARLVVKGYAQVYGVDYSDTFAPVARMDTIRLLLAVAAHKNWKVFQMDVKSAFLNGDLQEEIYVEQPAGFVVQGEEDKVYMLKKALYGLKQAPRAWYGRIDDYLTGFGFQKSLSELTLYVKKIDDDVLIVSLYVDDLLVTGSNLQQIERFKQDMMQAFEMSDLGLMSFFLGMEIKQSRGVIFIGQEKYAKEILKKFQMENCKPTATPMNQKDKFSKEDGTARVNEEKYRSLIGCLLYLTATRPDILYATNLLSRFMHCPSELHMRAAKRILRYIKGTCSFGVKFMQCKTLKLHGFSDSDWGGFIDDMKSTSGFCFNLGSTIFSWSSKKQSIVAQSTAEAEFIAATAAVNQALWLQKLLRDLHMEEEEATEISVDNQAAIAISNNPVFHGKTKHFNIKLYFIREVQKNGDVKLLYCRTEDQMADLFTKALPANRFEFLTRLIGVCSP